MKHIVATAFVFGVLAVTAWASTLHEDESKVRNTLEATSDDIANEAIMVGEILSHVADDLTQDKTFDGEPEEYSWRSFSTKFKAALKKAATKTKKAFNAIAKHAKESVEIVAKAVAAAAVQKAEEKLKEKAVSLVEKIFEKAYASYAVEDRASEGEFVRYFCSRLKQAGQRLIHLGETLKKL